MVNDNQKIKYVIYARKSTESEDRQVQSIDDQINRLTELAGKLNLKIIDVIRESKSAKKPDERPLFNQMIQRIEKGEINGILCWKLDRLFRNSVDFGWVQWLLQNQIIQSIQTYEREYVPKDNVILNYVESGMANQYVLDLSKNVRRGHRGRLERGWFPNKPATGYITNPDIYAEEKIIPDPERFDLVRKMWDLMLTGNYSANKILQIANENWGFRTKKARRLGGGKLSRSAIYRVFTNTFYAGLINWGEFIGREGKHKKMITLEEYDRVQIILGKKGKQRPKIREFPFTGFIHCGECGCHITAVTKTKLIKKTNELRDYTYYHCTKKKKGYKCSQNKVIRAGDLEEQIERKIAGLKIIPELKALILKKHRELNEKEVQDRTNIYETRHKTLVSAQSQLDRLLDLRLNEQISDDEYTRKRSQLVDEIGRLKELLRETEERAQDWLELSEKTFNFATYAHYHFINGDTQTKKTIASALGLNFSLKDGILHVEAHDWFIPIIEEYPEIENEYLRLELDKTDPSALSDAQKHTLENVCLKLSERGDLNP